MVLLYYDYGRAPCPPPPHTHPPRLPPLASPRGPLCRKNARRPRFEIVLIDRIPTLKLVYFGEETAV